MLFEDGTGFCPWHKKDSSFHSVHQIGYASPHFYSPMGSSLNRQYPDDPIRTGIVVMECRHCRQSVILLETVVRSPAEVEGDDDERRWRTMVYPAESPRTLHKSAPEVVRSLFEEASKCEKSGAFRAAGVMYRATVEELVKEQNATGHNLYDKIESLKGTLSTELVEDLHEARMLGNDSIHAGLTYSAEEVEDVAKLIEEAVLVLYVQPEEKRAMREARKARRDAGKP
ncbi:DUF4145 domain-containing protein [Nocardioides ochotonae]|uniref:DUF4145 domain-containing protein n=1 Tax=Nocardioides ochotonae TaxID=2685869 RepID=UPI001408C791|nr:DUF4145 domain-containing protein [Nocardioides ochotonae]